MASPATTQLNPPTLPFPTQLWGLIPSHIVLYEGQCPYLWFFSVQCVRLETPVVVKLPWLSLKPRPNEIWMCREWIRVMEWAKYCLCGVSAILSWGDRYSGLRKVKTPHQVQCIHQQAKRSLPPCNVDDCCATECFGIWGKTGLGGNIHNLYLWWGFDLKNRTLTTSALLPQIYYASDIQIPMVLKMQFAFNDLMKWVRTRKGTVLHKISLCISHNDFII